MIRKIIIVPHTHTDLGYTEMPHKVIALQVKYLRKAIQLAREAGQASPPVRFPWTLEALGVLREFFQHATEPEKKEFFDFVQRGLIELTGYEHQVQTQLLDLPELDGELGLARQLSLGKKLPMSTAVLDDLGGFSWNLPQLLNECGIRYYVMGVGGWRVNTPIAKLPHLFRLRGVDGKSSILVYLPGLKKGGSHTEIKFLLAQYGFALIYWLLPARGTPINGDFAAAGEHFAGDEALFDLVHRFEREGYPYDTLLLQCGSDNLGQYPDLAEAANAWNAKHPELELALGSFTDFFTDIEARYGDCIPEYSGELTCSWSAHVLTHAEGLGRMRAARRKLRTAEMLRQSLTLDEADSTEFTRMVQDAERQIRLFADHTFGLEAWGFRPQFAKNCRLHSGGRFCDYPRESWNFKADYARQAEMDALRAGRLLESSVIRASSAPYDDNAHFGDLTLPPPEVTFFNPLTHDYQGLLHFHAECMNQIALEIDGKLYPCDCVVANTTASDYYFYPPQAIAAGGFLHAVLHSNAAPPTEKSPFEIVETETELRIKWCNAELAISRQTARILSYQVNGVELQDDSNGTAINDFQGFEVDNIDETAKELGLSEKPVFRKIAEKTDADRVSVTFCGNAILTVQTLRCFGEGEAAIRVESEIELRAQTPELFFRNRVRKFVRVQHEAGYFLYPIKVDSKTWKLETAQQGYLHDYRNEKLDGAAIQNFAFQDFAMITDEHAGAILHSFQAGIMSVGETPKHFSPDCTYCDGEKPHLALYCYHNLWVTNTPQEQTSGDLCFDTALTPLTGTLPDDHAIGFALAEELQQEPIALAGRTTDGKRFLAIDNPLIGHYFRPDSGELRLVNYSRKTQTFHCSLWEDAPRTMTLDGCEIATVAGGDLRIKHEKKV